MSDETDSELHPAISLLLARMASNPEEFAADHSYDDLWLGERWGPYFQRFKAELSPAENRAVKEALRKIRMEEFHKELMQELVDPRAEREARAKQDYYNQMVKNAAMAAPSVYTAVGGGGGYGGYSNQQVGVAIGPASHSQQAVGLGSYNAALSQSEAFNKLFNEMYEQQMKMEETSLARSETLQEKLKNSFWGKK